MPDRVGTVFVHVRVQGGLIAVMDLFPFFRVTKELDGIGTPAKKSLARFQAGLQLQGVEKVLNSEVVFLLRVPLTFPHFHERVPGFTNELIAILRELINLSHAHLIVFAMQLVPMGKTRETPVIKTALEFLDGLGGGVEPVHMHLVSTHGDGMFALVVSVHELVLRALPLLAELMIDPVEPFHGGVRMGFAFAMPPSKGFRGDGEGLQAFFPVVTVARRRDGNAFRHGIEVSQSLEGLLKLLTPFFEQAHVGTAILHQFLLKMKFIPLRHFALIPRHEFGPAFGFHAFGVVIVFGRQGSDIVFMVFGIEEMGKEPFLQFFEPKGVHEIGQRHLQETHAVDEFEVRSHLHAQNFGAIDNLIGANVFFVKLFENEIIVIALKVMRHGNHLSLFFRVVGLGLFAQPIQKFFDARLPFKDFALVRIVPFSA